METWTDIRQWFLEEQAFIAQKYDSITIYTGDEGRGKSLTMLACNRAKDQGFGIDRVHFEHDPFMQQAVELNPGDAIQLDEFDGHKREAMHGHRIKVLKFLKERRSLRLRVSIGFPHFSQLDGDIRDKRVRYWAHKPSRRIMEVRSRLATETVGLDGQPRLEVKWILRGVFPIPDLSGPLVTEYEEKKEAYTRRDPEVATEAAHVFLSNPEGVEEVLREIRGHLASNQ